MSASGGTVTCLFKAVAELLNTEFHELHIRIQGIGSLERSELQTAFTRGCAISQMNRWLAQIEIYNVNFRRIHGQTGTSEQDDWNRAHDAVYKLAGTRKVALTCGRLDGSLGHAVTFRLESITSGKIITKDRFFNDRAELYRRFGPPLWVIYLD